jgi:hypothetical protein
MNRFDRIERVSVDEYGANYEVEGIWNDRPYKVKIECEFDGRDVESEPLEPGGFDPMTDVWAEPMFFDLLCQSQRFIDLHNEGYKIYETL